MSQRILRGQSARRCNAAPDVVVDLAQARVRRQTARLVQDGLARLVVDAVHEAIDVDAEPATLAAAGLGRRRDTLADVLEAGPAPADDRLGQVAAVRVHLVE